ncbi:hypothetical protein ACWEFJ_30540 [Actinosynnema sp. NPDC004786]
MTTRVHYVPEQRDMDLSDLSSADYQLITALHRQISKGDRVLLCLQDALPGRDELLIRVRDGKYIAAHFPGDAHDGHVIAVESDEHKRQKEYWYRAARDAGYDACTELTTDTGSILDVAIRGPRPTGIEVQRSRIAVTTAVNRTIRSHRAGWLPVWFADADRSPKWLHRVPSVGCNRISWDNLPPRRAATATGLRKIRAARCTITEFDHCPANGRGHCGRHHPKPVPWPTLTVDDVAELIPNEQAVPLAFTSQRVYLVPPEGAALFRQLTGTTGDYQPAQQPQPRHPRTAESRGCDYPKHEEAAVIQRPPWPRCRCGNEMYLLQPGRELCERCRSTTLAPL